MLRAVLAVVLSVAVVGVVAPALEDARVARGERQTEGELARVEAAVAELARGENVGARRTLTLSLPTRSVTRAPVAYVAVGGVSRGPKAADTGQTDVLVSRVAGGDAHVVRVPAELVVVTDSRSPDDDRPLVARGGTVRLTLRLVRDGEEPVVEVERSEPGAHPASRPEV